MTWLISYLLGIVYKLVYYAPLLIISITVHEFAHAKTAQKLGDPTAAMAGRVSLNPLRHLDPLGSLCMLFFGFGWGKPVPVAVLNFKNPKRGSALVALAGPVSNLLMACIWGFLFGTLYPILPYGGYVYELLLIAIQLNCVLCVFNLLPITPLDGSRILALLLPDRIYYKMLKHERTFFIILVVLMLLNILNPVIQFLANGLLIGIDYTFVSLGNLLYQGLALLF
jgi:Zn-dependent protease